MTGPPRIPNRLQAAKGDPRKIGRNKLQRLIDNEPRARSGLPECPAHLGEVARECWAFFATELEIMGLDKRPHAKALEGLCVAYEDALTAYQMIQKHGRVYVKKALDPKTGELVPISMRPHPAVQQADRAWSQLRAFCAEFGFTPASLTRLSIEKSEKPVALTALLGKVRDDCDDAPVLQ